MKMDAESFLKNAIDPLLWLRKSVALRRSGDRLWESFFESMLTWSEISAVGNEEDPSWDEVYAYITSAKMLYGLALETAFKAYILRSKPEDVSFKMSADGTGKVQDVEMKQFGVSMGTGHNLGVCPANA